MFTVHYRSKKNHFLVTYKQKWRKKCIIVWNFFSYFGEICQQLTLCKALTTGPESGYPAGGRPPNPETPFPRTCPPRPSKWLKGNRQGWNNMPQVRIPKDFTSEISAIEQSKITRLKKYKIKFWRCCFLTQNFKTLLQVLNL